jgi:hypothetical protein
MSASHPEATESLRSSEMTLSARRRPEQVQQRARYSITSSARPESGSGTVSTMVYSR